MEHNKTYEILAPVGDEQMFEAALSAGTQAVYLAGNKFGARAYASNFDLNKLRELVVKAHKNSVKVYLTLNTLIKDSEFHELYEYLNEISKIKLDALIIQDLGVYAFIKAHFPFFELHASTQMTVNNMLGAMYVEKLGFERLVVGREVSLNEIKNIKSNTKLEIEAFIHGSLCVSVSGQCLMSSLIGQRSGNRGRCAQPCRKTYDLYNQAGKKLTDLPDTFISARDLRTINEIQELLESGVYSLKIEGRMKKPEYVYAVVNEYAKALENMDFDPDRLALVSNRKFIKGFFLGDFGKSYYNSSSDVAGLEVGQVIYDKDCKIEFSKDVYTGDILQVTTFKNKKLTLTLTEDYEAGERASFKGFKDLKEESLVYNIYSNRILQELEEKKRVEKLEPIDMKLVAKIGNPIKAIVIASGQTYEVDSDFIVEKAQKQATSYDDVLGQMSRLGNTSYSLNNFDLEMDQETFLPRSKLNELRRLIVDHIEERFNKKQDLAISPYMGLDFSDEEIYDAYELTYEYYFDFNRDIDLSVFKRIYLHNMDTIVELTKIYKGEIYFVIPRIIEKDDYEQMLVNLTKYIEHIDGFAATDLGDIEALQRFDMPIHLESTLNIFNSYALDFYKKQEIYDFSLSQELSLDEIEKLKIKDAELEIIGYGRLSQMLLKHCPASIVKGCKDDSECPTCPYARYIKMANAQDTVHIQRAYGYSEVLTDKPIDVINLKEDLDRTKVRNIRIVDRGLEDIKETLIRYIKVFIEDERIDYVEEAYTGHYKLGVI